jgi:hypothetical protein
MITLPEGFDISLYMSDLYTIVGIPVVLIAVLFFAYSIITEILNKDD